MAESISQVVNHLFRHETGKIVSHLTRVLGTHNLELAEDAVQDALCRAVEVWALKGVPDNPAAWLLRAAKNRAIDVVRRGSTFSGKEAAITALTGEVHAANVEDASDQEDQHIRDDQLRMMFSCCHPRLKSDVQVALILKVLGGFSVDEIAHAYLSSVAAVEKRLSRGKQSLQEAKTLHELTNDVLAERIEPVQQALYLLFSEGYLSQHPEHAIREDLCFEAIRLALLLVGHPACSSPDGWALVALMCFQAARLPARRDAAGNLVLLADQDRALWSRDLIEQGFRALQASDPERRLSAYHLEAFIAAKHCAAARMEDTDWAGILELYEKLYSLKPTPIVGLNHAIAIWKVHGAARALKSLEKTDGIEQLTQYHYYFAARSDLHADLGNQKAAADDLRAAIKLCNNSRDRACLESKLTALMQPP